MKLEVPKASGQALTSIGELLGLERRHYWFFKEPDFLLRRRVIKSLKGSADS